MTDLPAYGELMLPVLRAVIELGGSGAAREISSAVVESEDFSDDQLAVTYDGREKSILLDRLDWARSYCKLGGVLESPKRNLFLVTDLGREIASLPDNEAHKRLHEVDREVRRRRTRKPAASTGAGQVNQIEEVEPPEENEEWREVILKRLHSLTPDAFEHFVMYLLRKIMQFQIVRIPRMRWVLGLRSEKAPERTLNVRPVVTEFPRQLRTCRLVVTTI